MFNAQIQSIIDTVVDGFAIVKKLKFADKTKFGLSRLPIILSYSTLYLTWRISLRNKSNNLLLVNSKPVDYKANGQKSHSTYLIISMFLCWSDQYAKY